jgi:hypothetical protein
MGYLCQSHLGYFLEKEEIDDESQMGYHVVNQENNGETE